MNNQEENDKKDQKSIKKVSTKVKCPHCGQEFETEVEVPEPSETPKITWLT